MVAAIALLNTLLPVLYAVAAVNASVDFFRDDPFSKRLNLPLLGAAIGAHATFFGLRTAHEGRIPVATVFELMTCVAFGLALVNLVVELQTRTHRTGMFVLSFSLVLQVVASAFVDRLDRLPDILRNPLLGAHTGAAVLGYTAFAVSAIYGTLYLLLYRELKSRRFGLVYRRLPSLDLLAQMSRRASLLGVICLGVAIAVGALWASSAFPGFTTDPKFILTVLLWTVYAAGLALHHAFHLSGRRTIYVFLTGFTLMVLSMVLVRFWLPSFHGFA